MCRHPALKILAAFLALWLISSALRETAAQEHNEVPSEEASPTDDANQQLQSDESNQPEMGDQSSDQSEVDAPQELTPAEDAFQHALQLEKQNKLDEAIDECTEAIRLDPSNLEYLATRGELYGELRQNDNALADADKLLELDRSNLRAHLLKGAIYDRAGDSDKALAEFNSAVEQNPTSWLALFQRHNYFDVHGQHDKALADSDRMIQVQPDLAAGYLSKAISHGAFGETDQALSYASALIQQNPNNPLAYTTRAAARGQKGDYDGARSDLEKAIALAPDNAFAFDMRSNLYFETGEYEKSIADLEKAIELQPRNYGFKADLAELLATCPDEKIRSGQVAAQLAQEALRLAPNDPTVWRAMAAAAAENGNFEEAAQWQERVALSNELPANLRRGNEQRLALYKSGKPYRRSVASPQRTVVLDSVQQADEAIKNGNYDRAIAVLSQAIAADDKDPVPYYGRGFAYYKQQQYESAIADFNRAIELNPKDVDSYFYRARSFENTRHYQKARDDLLKTYALDPEHIGGMHNNLAWFFATCPDDSIRDGGKASEYIDRGLELHPNFGPAWDTCAAVFAEIDDFDDAIDWEKAYLGRNDITDESRRAAEKRLDLYEHHQPFRNQPEADQPVSPSTTASPPEK